MYMMWISSAPWPVRLVKLKYGSTGSEHNDATCSKLIDKVGLIDRTCVTDDWDGYHRMIPLDELFIGKDLIRGAMYATPIKQDNSNVRHCPARFRCQTKMAFKCRTKVNLSLRPLHHLQNSMNAPHTPNGLFLLSIEISQYLTQEGSV